MKYFVAKQHQLSMQRFLMTYDLNTASSDDRCTDREEIKENFDPRASFFQCRVFIHVTNLNPLPHLFVDRRS